MSYPSQIESRGSTDNHNILGACSESAKDKFSGKSSDERHDDDERIQQHCLQQHSILEKLLRQEKNPRNSTRDDAELKMISPLVFGEELFDEDPDFDNESEWSIDIK